jgi:hypothetical protein
MSRFGSAAPVVGGGPLPDVTFSCRDHAERWTVRGSHQDFLRNDSVFSKLVVRSSLHTGL